MKIVVTCREVEEFAKKVDVYALYFNPESKVFSMSYCVGDMWGIDLPFSDEIYPFHVDSIRAGMVVEFDRHDEAEAFVSWLIEGEKKVQEGFRTMQG